MHNATGNDPFKEGLTLLIHSQKHTQSLIKLDLWVDNAKTTNRKRLILVGGCSRNVVWKTFRYAYGRFLMIAVFLLTDLGVARNRMVPSSETVTGKLCRFFAFFAVFSDFLRYSITAC
jgi:hypothetical protein